MDISKIKINPIEDGKVMVEMNNELVERFKLFCLIDVYLIKPTTNWVLNKIVSHPDGRVDIFCQQEPLTKDKHMR